MSETSEYSYELCGRDPTEDLYWLRQRGRPVIRRCSGGRLPGSESAPTPQSPSGGAVLLNVRGSKEAYLAWSEEPVPRGTEVLVIDIRGARTVLVEPWTL